MVDNDCGQAERILPALPWAALPGSRWGAAHIFAQENANMTVPEENVTMN